MPQLTRLGRNAAFGAILGGRRRWHCPCHCPRPNSALAGGTYRVGEPAVANASSAIKPVVRIWLLAAAAAHFLLPSRLHAQLGDSVYSGRRCDNHLRDLRMPLLAELGDTVRFADLLSQGADPQARITSIDLRFGKDGNVRAVHISHARSSSAGAQIRDSIRFAQTATCPVQQHLTPEATALLNEIHRAHPESRVNREAVVEFVLEADGQVREAWLAVSTGLTRVDSMAMEVFRAMRFDPAIVGRTPTAALEQQPFQF